MSQTSTTPKETNIDWNRVVIPIPEPEEHKHYFEWREGECRCKFCSFGLQGVVDIVDGKPM